MGFHTPIKERAMLFGCGFTTGGVTGYQCTLSCPISTAGVARRLAVTGLEGHLFSSTNSGCIQLCYSQSQFSRWIYQYAMALLHYSEDTNQCKQPAEVDLHLFSASTVVQSRQSTLIWTLASIVLFSKDRKQEQETRTTANRHKHKNITSTWPVED